MEFVFSIPGRYLVQGDRGLKSSQKKQENEQATTTTTTTTTTTIDGDGTTDAAASVGGAVPVLVSDVGLSFWGGIDPLTGMVIDQQHPLKNQCVAGTILCLPSGKGSCTASQVLLELIRNDKAPAAIILRDVDGLACVGALIAQEIFDTTTLDILHVGDEWYQHILESYKEVEEPRATTGKPASLFGGVILDHADDVPNFILGINEETVTEALSAQAERNQKLDSVPFTKLEDNKEEKEKENPAAALFSAEPSSESFSVTDEEDTAATLFSSSSNLSLTEEEKGYLESADTEAERMALRVIFRYARLVQPPKKKIFHGRSLSKHSKKKKKNMMDQFQVDDPSSSSSESSDPDAAASSLDYVPVSMAHIDGCTYIGPGGLQFVQLLAQHKGRVKVPTTLNSVSTDRQRWAHFDVPAEYAQNANALGDAYLQVGCQPSFTCAPYLLPDSTPDLAQQICWGESNAVVYANSVLGAYTEKYADYLDICCAIAGIVPKVGMHVPNNRKPQMILDATALFNYLDKLQQQQQKDKMNSNDQIEDFYYANDLDMLFPLLGHLCGTLSDGKVPILIGLEKRSIVAKKQVTNDHLKAFCAAFGTTAASPLIHIAGITPEANDWKDSNLFQQMIKGIPKENRRTIEMSDLKNTFQMLDQSSPSPTTINMTTADDSGDDDRVHLVALGNPHLSLSEVNQLARMIQQLPQQPAKKHAETRIMACMSRQLYEQARTTTTTTTEDKNPVAILEDFGMEFVNDTCWCMLLDPPVIPVDATAKILTNSGKYCHYGPGLTNRAFRFGSLQDCLETAVTGYYPTTSKRRGLPRKKSVESSSLTSSSSTAPAVAPVTMARRPLPKWMLAGPAAATATTQQRRDFSNVAIKSYVPLSFASHYQFPQVRQQPLQQQQHHLHQPLQPYMGRIGLQNALRMVLRQIR